MIERNQSADHRLLPDREADSVAVLQSECVFFILETEILSFRPHCSDLGCGATGTHQLNSGIKIVAAALVGIDHGV